MNSTRFPYLVKCLECGPRDTCRDLGTDVCGLLAAPCKGARKEQSDCRQARPTRVTGGCAIAGPTISTPSWGEPVQ